MNYLRVLTIPALLGILVALAACPKEPDTTTVSVDNDGTTPSTTIVDNTETPPSDTNVNIDVTTSAPERVVVHETVRTEHPDIVTVVEKQVTTPDDTTIYVAESPAIQTWTTQVVPANAPADVTYLVRDLNVTNATDTEITADGYVVVYSPSPDFSSERKYVTYTFRKDAAANTWQIADLAVTRSEAATPEDWGGTASVSDAGATGGTEGGTSGGDTGGSTGGDAGGAGGGS